MKDLQHTTYVVADGIARIGLDRPAKRNAVNDALLDEIERCVRRAHDEARAVVLFGHGEHFCAGLDLSEHEVRTPFDVLEHSRRWHRCFDLIDRGPVPVVAALRGAVIGGGLELAAAAHIRVADATAFFGLPEAQRGIYVGGGASVRVARLISAARMADMMLTGRTYGAGEAERANFVQYVVPDGEAADKAAALAAEIVKGGRLSTFAILQALPRIQDMGYEDGQFVESLMTALVQSDDEAAARMRDFLDGRVRKAGEG